MKKRTLPMAVICVCCALAPLVAGCNTQSPEIPKDAFQRKPMPPEAEKGMREAMQRAGKPPTAH